MDSANADSMATSLRKLRDAACEAWLYGLPLIEMATTRSRLARRDNQLNTLSHVRDLLDHRARDITMPNNDTLYSSAQLDLSQGPVTLVVPASGDRYLSVALMDAYTNNFAILGTRTTGPDGGTFRIVGPGDAADGGNIVRSPTNDVWVLARVLVDGPHDLAAARAVQSGLSMQGPAHAMSPERAERSAPWQDYFASVDALMAANRPPVTDLALLRRIAPLGLGTGSFDAGRFSAAEAEAIALGVSDARQQLRGFARNGGGVVGGWSYPATELGNFGQSYAFRAVVALVGLAALPPEEAMYLTPVTATGVLFDGAQDWCLHLAADQMIPVDAFWSLSMYEVTPDGQFFFTENPLNRFSIGDRTPGLAYNPDGSLDIWIGHNHPGAECESNWLPAPAGKFRLNMRAYLPHPALLQGDYRLPEITLAA